MSIEFIRLLLEVKKIVFRIPVLLSFLLISLFFGWVLDHFLGLGRVSYLSGLILPFFNALKPLTKSEITEAFMEWWGSKPVYVHWLIIDVFAYYWLGKAYLPDFLNKKV